MKQTAVVTEKDSTREKESTRLPTVLSTASRLFHKEECVVTFLSSVNHTVNKSTEAPKPPFPLMISPMNHNPGGQTQ